MQSPWIVCASDGFRKTHQFIPIPSSLPSSTLQSTMHFHPSLSLTPPLYYILPLLPFFLPCHKVWFCYIHHWQILTGIFHLLFFISPFSYPFFLHLFFFPLMPLLLQLEDMRERCKLHMQRVRTKPDSQLGLRLSDLSSCEHYNRMSNRTPTL